MKQFEYCVVFLQGERTCIAKTDAGQIAEGPTYLAVFNKIGLLGWELVLSEQVGSQVGEYTLYYFKREVVQ